MSYITWITQGGNLGTIPENVFYEKGVEATDSGGATVLYRHLSGTLPPGLQVLPNGTIQGIPQATVTNAKDDSYTYTFAVRASNLDGNVADRSFSVTISGLVAPVLVNTPGKIDTIFDGT